MPVIAGEQRKSHGPSAIAAITTGVGILAVAVVVLFEIAAVQVKNLVVGDRGQKWPAAQSLTSPASGEKP